MNSKGSIAAFSCLAVVLCLATYLVGRDINVVKLAKQDVSFPSEGEIGRNQDYIVSACEGIERSELTSCLSNVLIASRENRRAELGLIAQERSATYALWALVLSTIGSIVASLGIFFVARTLRVTEQSNRDTNRAYIQIDEASLRWGNDKGSLPHITLLAKNTGQTPAVWFEVFCVAHAVDEDRQEFDQEFYREEIHAMKGSKWHGFAANSSQTLPGVQRDEDRKSLKEAYDQYSPAIRVFGLIRYQTFFDEVFESEFLFEGYPTPKYVVLNKEQLGTKNDKEGIPVNYTSTVERSWRIPKAAKGDLLVYEAAPKFF